MSDFTLFALQWLTPYAIIPALAGVVFGVLIKTPRARLAFVLIFLTSAAAFAAVRMSYFDGAALARASIIGLFASFGLSGPALIDDWLLAAIT